MTGKFSSNKNVYFSSVAGDTPRVCLAGVSHTHTHTDTHTKIILLLFFVENNQKFHTDETEQFEQLTNVLVKKKVATEILAAEIF